MSPATAVFSEEMINGISRLIDSCIAKYSIENNIQPSHKTLKFIKDVLWTSVDLVASAVLKQNINLADIGKQALTIAIAMNDLGGEDKTRLACYSATADFVLSSVEFSYTAVRAVEFVEIGAALSATGTPIPLLVSSLAGMATFLASIMVVVAKADNWQKACSNMEFPPLESEKSEKMNHVETLSFHRTIQVHPMAFVG